jgi:hypothetical protein
MPSRFMKWLRGHQKSAGFLVTITYGLLVLAAGPIGWFAVSDVKDKPLSLLIGLVISFAIGQIVIFTIALLWLTDYHLLPRSSKRTTVEIFSNPINFARKKCDVLRDLELQSVNTMIYGVSHCNLFAKPEGDDAQQKDVREYNSSFFRALADIVMRSDNPDVKLRILLHYDDEDIETNLVQELKARQEIFTKSGHALSPPTEWNSRDHFDVKRGLIHSAIDYFVIQDHVFITIRQTPGIPRSTYIYIRGQELAKSYWSWLDDLYEYGEDDGLVERRDIQAIFNRIKLESKAK